MKQPSLIGVLIATLLLSACAPAAQAPAPTAAPTEASTAAPALEPTAPPQAAATPLDPAAAATVAGAPEAAAADTGAAEVAALVAAAVANPWKWMSLTTASDSVLIDAPDAYLVAFQADGTLDITADCNTVTGTYALDGTRITIEIGATTLVACPGDSRGEQFLQLLGEATQMVPVEGRLFITLQSEDNVMLFDAVRTTVADLCGDGALAVSSIDDRLAPAISAQLDQALVRLVQSAPRPGPGAVMLIITPQGRYFKSTGVADVTTCTPLAADSAYQIGSNTKLMTSAILFQLQEEGVLAIADPLSKWLPELAAQLPNGDQITIDMLLTHTSGLHDYFDVPIADGLTIADGTTNNAMLTRAFTPQDLVTLVAESGLSDFTPGAEGRWNYSNTGYILLGLIIEKASGKSYEANLNERIFAPLRLEQTYLQTGLPEPGALPQAYYRSPFDFTTSEWNASQGWSAGGVVSTPEEFAAFLKALFTGKLFTQPETLDLMQQHTAAGVDALGTGTVYGHGMLNNQGVLGHGGQTLGFQSDGGYIPDQDVTIVLWSNAAESNVSRAIIPALAAALVGTAQAEPATQGAVRLHELPGHL